VTYIMDTAFEGVRIERKTDRAMTIAQLQWAGVSGSQRVLDLGCASGTTTRLIADVVGPSGNVVGVDVSGRRLEEAVGHVHHVTNITYREGDATSIPAVDGAFDVAWSRFLFEYLPQPAKVLDEMIRVTVPGGLVCVSDLDGNCTWHHPMDDRLRCEIDDALRVLRDDFCPNVGRQIYAMFVDAGLQEIEVAVRPYHIIAGRIGPEQQTQWTAKIEGVAEALVQRGWLPGRVRRLCDDFATMLADPRSFSYSVLISVRGRVPTTPAQARRSILPCTPAIA